MSVEIKYPQFRVISDSWTGVLENMTEEQTAFLNAQETTTFNGSSVVLPRGASVTKVGDDYYICPPSGYWDTAVGEYIANDVQYNKVQSLTDVENITADKDNVTVEWVGNNGGQLVKGIEGGNTGYWLRGDDRDNKGDIGYLAIDMVTQTGQAGVVYGAPGDYAISTGLATGAHGRASSAQNAGCFAKADYSNAQGFENTVLETAPDGANVEGKFANDVGTGKQSVIGIGTSNSDRKDGRVMYTDGTMELPEATNDNINSRGGRAVVHKEWVEDKVSGISETLTMSNINTMTFENGLLTGYTLNV